MKDESWETRDLWMALGLAWAFCLLYLRTLCPTVYLGDSGEICTAIATGGIIHPPGYPLFSLLGRISLTLIPWGEPAFRIGCLVAIAGGLSIGVLYLLARDMCASLWSAAIAATVFGLSRSFWSQSTRVEVYSLHILLVALALLGAVRYHRTGRLGFLVLGVLAFSLGLAHHLTVALVAPVLAALCVPRWWKESDRGRRLLVLVGVLAVGPSLYLLLMVWARAEPLQAWGEPTTLPLLWNHASGRFYRNLLQPPDLAFMLRRLEEARRLLIETFPAFTGLLTIAGLWRLIRHDRRLAIALLLLPVAALIYNCCYRIDDIGPYFLTTWLVASALVALALDHCLRLIREPRLRIAPMAAATALLIGLPLAGNWRSCDLSQATWVREFARHKLLNADPGSILITATDNDTFPVWYVQRLLQVRPDVAHLDRAILNGTWLAYNRDPSLWYLHRLRRQGVAAPLDLPRDPQQWAYQSTDGYLIDLLQGPLRDRPICMSFFGSSEPPERDRQVFFHWAAARYEVLPIGIDVRLQPRSQPVDLPALLRENERRWADIRLPDLRHARTDDELDPQYVAHHYACSLVNLGGLYEMAGRRDRAAALYRHAAEWAPTYRDAARALAALRESPSRQPPQPPASG